jgi:hypothetical protein
MEGANARDVDFAGVRVMREASDRGGRDTVWGAGHGAVSVAKWRLVLAYR